MLDICLLLMRKLGELYGNCIALNQREMQSKTEFLECSTSDASYKSFDNAEMRETWRREREIVQLDQFQ